MLGTRVPLWTCVHHYASRRLELRWGPCRQFLEAIVCGSSNVEKAIMAPRVNKNQKINVKKRKNAAEKAIAELKKHVEQNSDYVGANFAKEARAMYLGDLPERPIYGEAKADEAKSLIDDGIPVTPLPFTPNRKTN